MTNWQKVLLVICSMAFVLVCRMSRACGEHPESVEHLAYVVVAFVAGVTIPGKANGE